MIPVTYETHTQLLKRKPVSPKVTTLTETEPKGLAKEACQQFLERVRGSSQPQFTFKGSVYHRQWCQLTSTCIHETLKKINKYKKIRDCRICFQKRAARRKPQWQLIQSVGV